MNTIILYNPISTTPGKQPLPLSLMSLAAVLEGRYDWVLVDGNVTADPAARIIELAHGFPNPTKCLLAVTVMPGPQLAQAIPVCKRVRTEIPDLPILWGGYFPTQHSDVILKSDFVDYTIRSQGEHPFLALLDVLQNGGSLNSVPSLAWKDNNKVITNPLGQSSSPETFPDFPYHCIDMKSYIHKNYLGSRTTAHCSSFGCPFSCNFCAVVAMSNRKWLAQSPERMEQVARHLVKNYQVNGLQMHDMDFFVSETRTAEYCERISDLNLGWWGLGRIDTLMRYSDSTWRKMQKSGLKMVFMGAESGSDETLALMNKGGNASTKLTLDIVKRMKEYNITPECSFVLGSPPDPLGDMQRTMEFIRQIKQINPFTEIILYIYTPVPFDGILYEEAQRLGFQFPQSLEEWVSEDWRKFSMRRGDHIPWVEGEIRRQARNFERVVNAYYPTITDMHLSGTYRIMLKALSAWRYHLRFYEAPYELRIAQRLVHYQRPETTGF